MSGKALIRVDIVSDILCPWCWVGKRKLEGAMQAASDRFYFVVRWLPFMLRPGMPLEGVEKAPEDPSNPRVGARLKQAGLDVGIDFTGKCPRYPNTLPGHALLHYAKEHNGGALQNDLAEAIFQAYFTDGIVPDAKSLVKIAEKVGFDPKIVSTVVNDPAKLEAVRKEANENSMRAVSGVPTFFMNGQRTFSGAQDTNAFIRMFEKISEKFPAVDESESSPAQL